LFSDLFLFHLFYLSFILLKKGAVPFFLFILFFYVYILTYFIELTTNSMTSSIYTRPTWCSTLEIPACYVVSAKTSGITITATQHCLFRVELYLYHLRLLPISFICISLFWHLSLSFNGQISSRPYKYFLLSPLETFPDTPFRTSRDQPKYLDISCWYLSIHSIA